MLSTRENVWLVPHAKLEGISLMDHLFGRMNGMYPNKWRANFRDEQAIDDWKAAWAEAFDEDGITPHDVADGIKNCRRMYDWPPSLPEFLRACRPSLDPEIAFHEAVKGLTARRKGEMGEWSHPAIFYAAVEVGQYDMLNSAYGTMRARWEKALDKQMAKGQWNEIPAPALALPEPRKTELSDAEATKAMEHMGAGGALKEKKDHKAWAKKILANPKGYASIAVTMAKRALGEEVAA
ncbi:MAG: hypothetical protein KUL86_06695 [Castellaniella sp.]|nr:hypothetical protein [Castellaniella sp.]